MLAQLDKLDGVEAAMANRSGSLVRVRLADGSPPDQVAAAVSEVFASQGRKAKRLTGAEAGTALEQEEWRDVNSVGELSLIEARTIFTRRIEQFIESSGLDDAPAGRLRELSQQVLDEFPTTDSKYDNPSEYRRDLNDRLLEGSAPILPPEQQEQLRQQLTARIRG